MNKKIKIIVPITLIIIIVILVLKIVGSGSATDSRRQNLPIVKVEQPIRETVTYELKFNGDILSIQQANIFSKVNGNLEKIFVDMGSYVTQNQLLALIDTTELYQQYQQTAATYQNMRLNYDRIKELFKQSLVSKQDYDNSEAAMKVAKANFESANIRLEYAHITAPFAGFITKRFLDRGALVNSNNTTLFTLMDLNAMKIIVNVLEKDIPLIRIGKKAVLSVDAFRGTEFTGTVARISEAVDLSTRTMPVEIDIPNKDHLLKPGMFASVTLIFDEHHNAITVPTQAILRDDKGNYLFIVNDKFGHRRDIKIGKEQSARTEILSGLDGSESIITVGQQFAKDGGQVIIQ